ncbi:MAG: alpha/beta hydrolase [Rubrivivax sp.]|jgi:pimeloyl-ACP methyl ester carboxylesterase|nr:alpha/beta hydrolase [Rubrivivax sp.]
MSAPPCQPRRPSRSEFVTVRGLRHHLHRWPATTPGSSPPLVMMHGWMDVAASFQFIVDALEDDREVVAPDWRGFGRTESPHADCYWFPDYLGDLDGLLDAISPDAPVDLLGHSMGGNVVMSYAGVRPQRIRRLVNLEGFGMPAARPSQGPRRLVQWLDELKTPQTMRDYASLAEVAERLMRNNPRLSAERAAWLAPHWAEQRADGRWHVLGDPAHKRPNPLLYHVDEVLESWKAIRARVLWIEGADTDIAKWWGDRYTKPEFHRRLDVVPHTERHVIADCGHMLHHDQPEAVAAHLRRFLAD